MAKLQEHAAPWSYSKLKSFNTCPKQFFHLKVVGDYEEPQHESALYGDKLHKAAELYVRDRESLPSEFAWLQDTLDRLMDLAPNRLAEYKLALRQDLTPCGFFDDDVWWRGVVDLLVLDPVKSTAWVFDHKSGKDKYADAGQLDLMALATFIHFPQVETIKAGLLFHVAESVVKKTYHREDAEGLWGEWLQKFKVMKAAYDNDVWNANQSGLCRAHCAVLECPHNGRG